MPRRKKRTDLLSLVDKYQGLSVVSEIEHNLLNASKYNYPLSYLIINDLYNENNYDLSTYENLKQSLKKDGFLVPLIIVKVEGKYEIINGVKRFLLGKSLGFTSMPCVLADIQEERKIEYIIENIIEEQDNPLVKTYAFTKLEEKYNYSDFDIASISKLSLTQVRNLKRLNSLPDFLKEGLKSNKLTYSEARCLLNLPLKKQEELYMQILTNSISVRDLEKEKRIILGTKKKRKVSLKGKKITITFDSEEEASRQFKQIFKEYSD